MEVVFKNRVTKEKITIAGSDFDIWMSSIYIYDDFRNIIARVNRDIYTISNVYR